MPAKKANKVRRRFTIRMRTCEAIEDSMDGLLALAALKHSVFVPWDEVRRDMAWLNSGINPDTEGKPVR